MRENMKKTVSRIGIAPQYLRKGRFKRMNFRLQALYFCLLQYVDHAGCWDIDLIDLEEDFSSDVTMLDLDKLESAGHILFDDTKTTLLVTNFIESHYNGKPSPTNSKHYPFFKVIEERRMFVSEDMSSISFQMNENEAFKVETVPWSNYGHKSTKLAINLIHKQSLKELCFAQPSTAKHSLAVIREDIDKDKIREEEKRDIKGEEKQPLPKSESMAQLEEALEEEKPETASKYVEFKEEEQDPSKMSLKAINFEVVSLKRALNGKTPARKKKTLERLNSLQSEVKARRVCFTVD